MARSTPEWYREGDLQFIIKIGRVVTEVEIAEEDEVVELLGSEPSKVSGSFTLAQ